MSTTTVDRVSELSLRLERAIVSGEFSAGERLPPERQLSSQFQVSRSVVREALGRLVSLGLVESKQGSGTRVTNPSGKQVSLGYERLLREVPERLIDLAQIRLLLETSIAELAAQNRTADHLRDLQAVQDVLRNPRRSLVSHVRADVEFHSILAEATCNPFFPLVLAPIHDLLTESRLQTLRKYGASIAYQHHEQILEAVRNQDPESASQTMRNHLLVNSRHLQELDESKTTIDNSAAVPSRLRRRNQRVPR